MQAARKQHRSVLPSPRHHCQWTIATHGSVEVCYQLWSVLLLKERRAGTAWLSSTAYVVQPESVRLMLDMQRLATAQQPFLLQFHAHVPG